MPKKYDTIVYIGRFQPFHNAHYDIIQRAKTLANRVIIVVGSADQPRTYKNPFTCLERHDVIFESCRGLLDADFSLTIASNQDTIYNDQAWAVRVQEIVAQNSPQWQQKVAIIGHDKDESTFYLKMFPQWERVDVELIQPLDATDIRDLYFKQKNNMGYIQNVVPRATYDFLYKFRRTEAWEQIIREREFVANYKKQFAALPYPPVFVTTDAVVIQSGHVLLIKRKAEPGRGLWALPGGFLNADTDKSVLDCAIRELKEETGIKIPKPVLIGSIEDSKVFDAIGRSTRGRTITHAFKIVLPDGDLPKVKGQDDAEKAKWVPIGELDSSVCYEDHYEIIQHFVGA